MSHPLGPFPHNGRAFLLRWACGPFARPVSYPWGPNPWNEWRLFTIRLPYVCLPFLSVSARWFHGYIGGKSFMVDASHTWAHPDDYGTQFVTVSVRGGFGARR